MGVWADPTGFVCSFSTPRSSLEVADVVVAPPGALTAAVLLGAASALLFLDGFVLNCFGFSCAPPTTVKPASTATVNKNRISLLESERPINLFEARPMPRLGTFGLSFRSPPCTPVWSRFLPTLNQSFLAFAYVNPFAQESTRSNQLSLKSIKMKDRVKWRAWLPVEQILGPERNTQHIWRNSSFRINHLNIRTQPKTLSLGFARPTR